MEDDLPLPVPPGERAAAGDQQGEQQNAALLADLVAQVEQHRQELGLPAE